MDEPEPAVRSVPLSKAQLDVQHAERLEKPRNGQWTRVDGLKAELLDETENNALGVGIVGGDEAGELLTVDLAAVHRARERGVERLDDAAAV